MSGALRAPLECQNGYTRMILTTPYGQCMQLREKLLHPFHTPAIPHHELVLAKVYAAAARAGGQGFLGHGCAEFHQLQNFAAPKHSSPKAAAGGAGLTARGLRIVDGTWTRGSLVAWRGGTFFWGKIIYGLFIQAYHNMPDSNFVVVRMREKGEVSMQSQTQRARDSNFM